MAMPGSLRCGASDCTPRAGGVLWGQIQELRGAIEDFKTSGKGVTAFLEAAGGMEYYLATAADRIVMLPAGQLDLGPWEQVFYVEFDGRRKKRVVVKVLGE